MNKTTNNKKLILIILLAFYVLSYAGLRLGKMLVYRVSWNNKINYETKTHDTSVSSRDISSWNDEAPLNNSMFTFVFKPLIALELAVRPKPKPLANYTPKQLSAIIDTHKASLSLRQKAREKVLTKKTSWPGGAWGDTMWELCALYQNEKIDLANQRLLDRSQNFTETISNLNSEKGFVFLPENYGKYSPWAYFAITDYVRILSLFNSKSTHFPGRLKPTTEKAMKEALWLVVKEMSRVKDASLDNLLVLYGTENHDLTLRPVYYLVAGLLKNDPEFKERKYNDGYTALEHYDAYNRFFQEWPVQRIKSGLWFEIGSDTYQKYSWPSLFNMQDLSLDPLVRKRFGMLMDIAFIEEAQISVNGRRGGGRSRAGYGKNSFETYKNLLYAPEGLYAGSSHSKVIETSSYQLPAAAILLRKTELPAPEPFVIENRILGELKSLKKDNFTAYTSDSALINYAYRTPHYIMGSTLQNPALSITSPDSGKAILKYSGISRQNRWYGILFDDPDARQTLTPSLSKRTDDEICAIFPEIQVPKGGRPQHPHWSFQHENVLFIQRIDNQPKGMGSYHTNTVSMRFHGKKLKKIEQDGWIFASNGKAYAAVKFINGGYTWDESGELASPLKSPEIATSTRYLIHSGDKDSHDSFEAFQKTVLANPLTIEANRIVYQASPNSPQLECFLYDPHTHRDFKLPKINGQVINLRPSWAFKSPYLNNQFEDDQVKVSVGPVHQNYDFRKAKITH
ncbi:hypothetical protein PQO01_10200 [Lentisphaera marina]|uniref:hypothetical protein n=1 Tax=Lentisphaera marina TaxID=1111041 RepID=UPI00236620B6|nr:hypothetical protein [Lentisphaera marina]MDD7985323.1 hypothetical protein [Lentisphaera marina]